MNKIIVVTKDELEEIIENKLAQKQSNEDFRPKEQFLDIEQASLFLKIAKQTIYGYTSQRRIPYIKKGKKLYFKRSELENWLNDGTVKTREQMLKSGKI